jgi:hypothetical protein
MVDALALGASGVTRGGSSPLPRTIENQLFQPNHDPCRGFCLVQTKFKSCLPLLALSYRGLPESKPVIRQVGLFRL